MCLLSGREDWVESFFFTVVVVSLYHVLNGNVNGTSISLRIFLASLVVARLTSIYSQAVTPHRHPSYVIDFTCQKIPPRSY